MPSLTVRQYNPDSGALLSNISTLTYGRITAGTHSRVLVIDIAFSDVTNVGQLRLGLISSAGLTVNTSPTDIDSDGTSSNGYFGVEYSDVFDATKTASPLSRHFAGLNATITSADQYNASIPMRTPTISDYIYLDIEVSSSSTGAGNGSYKIFFDFN